MGTKLKPARFDCYANALPDEPMFILLARDASAAGVVSLWAMERLCEISQGRRPDSDRPMVEEARQCAKDMAEWRSTNYGKWREPKPAPPPLTISTDASRPAPSAIADVIKERNRQINVERYDAAHDDEHTDGSLALAAVAYTIAPPTGADITFHERTGARGEDIWPWSQAAFKPRSTRENLVRAAALLVAEIERIDRLTARTKAEPGL